MKILIIDNNTSFLKKIMNSLGDVRYEVINFKNFREEDAERFTHIILSGGKEKLDLNLFNEEKKLIENSEKPILGICFGYQLIAKIFGGKPVKMDSEKRGYFGVNLIKKDVLFDGLKEKINVYFFNLYSMKNFREKLDVLGKSEFGDEIIKHRGKKLYGVQFHPEVGSEGKKIIKNFLKFS